VIIISDISVSSDHLACCRKMRTLLSLFLYFLHLLYRSQLNDWASKFSRRNERYDQVCTEQCRRM